MDYFLVLQDFTQEMNLNEYVRQLSSNSYIHNVVRLDIEKLKSKENLLTY